MISSEKNGYTLTPLFCVLISILTKAKSEGFKMEMFLKPQLLKIDCKLLLILKFHENEENRNENPIYNDLLTFIFQVFLTFTRVVYDRYNSYFF